MDHHAPAAPVDPQELDRAQSGWINFTKFAKYSIIFLIILLSAMATFLV